MKNYSVLDIETTGLSSYKHAITEIAVVKYDGKKVIDEYQVLINPERHVPSNITRLTGITNEMVENEPVLEKIFPEFLDFVGDDILVAHNASFDMGFLSQKHLDIFDTILDADVLCTRKLANRILPDLKSKSLGSLCTHFQVVNEQAHRALADARATVEILEHFLSFMSEQDIIDQGEILLIQDTPRYKCPF